MGALLGAGQAVSVRSRPKVAIVSCCVRPAPASRCCEARPGRGGTPGSRRGPPQPPSSDAWQHLSPAWGRGGSERRERGLLLFPRFGTCSWLMGLWYSVSGLGISTSRRCSWEEGRVSYTFLIGPNKKQKPLLGFGSGLWAELSGRGALAMPEGIEPYGVLYLLREKRS